MQYPLISEYIDAIRNAEDNFDKLSNLRPVLDNEGNPIMSSGNFAVVFKMKDINDGKLYAIKCFTREQDGRDIAYKLISEELNYGLATDQNHDIKSYLIGIEYFEHELFVDSPNSIDTEFPVLLMDWVDGINLEQFIYTHQDDNYALHYLFGSFCRLAVALLKSTIAHGDLKPDNILVRNDGSIVLVDYDGMYVPSMCGQKARELGSPDFRHPDRSINNFDDTIDIFAIAIIMLTLAKLEVKTGNRGMNNIFLIKDYYPIISSDNINSTPICSEFISDIDCFHYYILNRIIKSKSEALSFLKYKYFSNSKYYKRQIIYSGGLSYNFDGRKLLRMDGRCKIANIRLGVEVICSNVMYDEDRCVIILPKTLKIIAKNAFRGQVISFINHSDNFLTDDYGLYTRDGKRLIKCTIPQDKSILRLKPTTYDMDDTAIQQEYWQFEKLWDYPFVEIDGLSYARENNVIDKIRAKQTLYEAQLFEDEYGAVYSPDKKKLLHFPVRSNLRNYSIIEGCEEISENAFKIREYQNCLDPYRGNKIENLYLPNSLKKISHNGLVGCKKLRTIFIDIYNTEKFLSMLMSYEEEDFSQRDIPLDKSILTYNTYCTIEEKQSGILDESGVLYSADGLKLLQGNDVGPNYIVKQGTKIICDGAFYGRNVPHLFLPDSIIAIGNSSFCNCNFEQIIIPKSVIQIGSKAFSGVPLIFVKIDAPIRYMGLYAFSQCSSHNDKGISTLKYVELGEHVLTLGDSVFYGCEQVEKISIPSGVMFLDGNPFANSGIRFIQNESANFYLKNGNLIDGWTLIAHILEDEWCEIPNGIYEIGANAFSGNRAIVSIRMDNDVKYISNGAFRGCEKLEDCVLCEGLEYIGDYAFDSCPNLKNINIPRTVTYIGKDIFGTNTSNINNIYVNSEFVYNILYKNYNLRSKLIILYD